MNDWSSSDILPVRQGGVIDLSIVPRRHDWRSMMAACACVAGSPTLSTLPMPMMAMTCLIVLEIVAPGPMAIAIMGMVIVAIALSFITLFISTLPRVLEYVEKYLPETEDPHAKRAQHESVSSEEEEVTAAIGFVLHTEFQKQRAREQVGSKHAG
jgi:Na+-transporting methylmalonyl-CoA/oxaloacetate decarboxylase gamma subunit